jgi:monofunctional glycosyltransferase
MKPTMRQLLRCAGLLALCAAALQLTFALRIAVMSAIDPQSTAFERSEAWRLVSETRSLPWRQDWVDHDRISVNLQRAVIASEDAAFADHAGIDWESIEKAWERNARAEARTDKVNGRAARSGNGPTARRAEPRIVGGSTITQQLAKNLFLSGERTILRKGQEFLITVMLETMLSKQRILEIYLNHVEWGEGVFGAQAAARHYFRVDAAQLGAMQAARLAVVLPAPKRFEKRPGSAYVAGRAGTIAARMGDVELP